MSIVTFILFFIAIVQIGLLVVLFVGGQNRSSRAFGVLAIAHTLWVTGHGLLHGLNPEGGTIQHVGSFLGFESPESFAHALHTFIYFVGGITGSAFLYFTITFTQPIEKNIPLYVPLGLFAIHISLLPLYLSGHIIAGASYVGGLQQWVWEYGPLWFLFDISFAPAWAAGLYMLWKQRASADQTKRMNFTFMFWAMIFGVAPAVLLNIILPRFGIYDFDWLGPITGIGWLTVIFYSIVKHQQLQVKTVFTELLVILAGIIVFANILITGIAENFTAALESFVKTLVFGTFVVVGHRLIINILEEAKRKRELERLNKELKTLHEDLESTVFQRTYALSEAKLHSETILENLTLGIVEYDETFTVLRINRAAENILGIGRNTIVGNIIQPKDKRTRELSSLAMVLYPALSEQSHRIEGTSDYEAHVLKNEITITHPKKKDLHVVTVGLEDAYERGKNRYIKLIRDVTKEKSVEHSKSEFIKIAAHQLRTPLSGTKWALRTTLDEDFGPLSKHQKTVMKKAYDMNKSLIDIVNDLLNVTKIEENFGYRKNSNDIIATVKEALLSSLLLAKNKSLQVTLKKGTQNIPNFDFDYTKLLIAVKNIVANAIEYTPKGGDVIVKVFVKNNHCVIEVNDTGIGIDQEDVEHIFTKFYRAKKARELVPLRSGLGLYIAKNIVEMHNGSILFNEAEGGGTRVQIVLPMTNSALTPPPNDNNEI